MFGNFIYFIVALLIYTTYQPASEAQINPFYSLAMFFGLIGVFAAGTRMIFNSITNRIGKADFASLDYQFNSAVSRQAIMAIFIYAIDIYLLNIGVLLRQFTFFRFFPTLEALCFLGLFIFYLCVVWTFAYDTHIKLYKTGEARKDYILSNITFSLPVLLPWFILSITADIINILPFELPKKVLLSTEGQIVYFLGFLVIIAIIGPALIQRFWGCRPLKPGSTRLRIELLCKKTNMAYKEIMVWPLFGGRMITAGVMGLVRRFRYILVTPALLNYLEPYEIDAVVAHEIGHIKKKHLLFYLMFFAGYLILAFSTLDFVTYGIIYIEAVYGLMGQNGAAYATFTSISFSIMMIVVFLVYFRFIFGYFMRNFERQADAYAYTIMGDAAPLITTFEKIAAASGQPPDRPNWHHFSIKERIDYLQQCQSDARWVNKHNKKVKKSILIYILALFLVGWMGFQLNFGAAGERINAGFIKSLVEKRLQKEPKNAELHVFLGDLYFSEENIGGAAEAYEQALTLEPENVRALNNLAWLYATAEKEAFYRPERSLELARRAARIEKAPHILDTLAESYFINGRYEKAVKIEEQALDMATGDTSHYREQLERFRRAVEGISKPSPRPGS
ncbi:MAG: M48 family metalloprotease [Desulfobacterales bacterium]